VLPLGAERLGWRRERIKSKSSGSAPPTQSGVVLLLLRMEAKYISRSLIEIFLPTNFGQQLE